MAEPKKRNSIASVQSHTEGGMKAMVAHEQRQYRMAAEEDEELINSMVAQGQISQEEAQTRLARRAMHKQTQQEEQAGNAVKGIVMAGVDFQTTEQLLEDLLDDAGSQNIFVKWIRDISGISWLEKKYKKEYLRRKQPNFRHRCPRLNRAVHTHWFEAIMGFIMMINGITIGIAASYAEPVSWVSICEHLFTAIFILEIFVRMIADSWIWLFSVGNFLDTSIIVLTGVLPLWILQPMGIESGGAVRGIQVVRVLRLARLVRMVRTIKEFRVLWKLIQGLTDSGRTLMWMYVLMAFVLYTLSIFAVYWIGRAPALLTDEFAQDHFGTVFLAMYTLFQSATLDSWTSVVRPLWKTAPEATWEIMIIFLVTIMLSTIVLLNLVTAIIVSTAFMRAKEDEELRARELQEMKEAEIAELSDLFLTMDEDGSGFLDREEYDFAMLYNKKVGDKLEILGVEQDDSEELWALLDDGSGQVSVQRFCRLLMNMQGEAKAKDGFTVVKTISWVNRRFDHLQGRLQKQTELVERTYSECQVAHRQLGGALQAMVEFLVNAGSCIPDKPAASHASMIKERHEKNLERIARVEEESRANRNSGRQVEEEPRVNRVGSSRSVDGQGSPFGGQPSPLSLNGSHRPSYSTNASL